MKFIRNNRGAGAIDFFIIALLGYMAVCLLFTHKKSPMYYKAIQTERRQAKDTEAKKAELRALLKAYEKQDR
ncbi:hypothetical protein DENIS_3938 [Desulfonema ishimotonii]|uniref:Uncharacterized protein n=2 Tax=Desulfonema ishimotonii TaxID=45657 RepID=A0A401G191_9BACT|nr:hypothetical protein DENIS_3938 [Desulfonema ishimotonii]